MDAREPYKVNYYAIKQVQYIKISVVLEKYQEEILHFESGKTLRQVAQKSCGCPILRGVQGQVRWGSEQPGLVEDVPGLWQEDLELLDPEDPFQSKSFYDSKKREIPTCTTHMDNC